MNAMPMTPAQQQLITETVRYSIARTQELLQGTGFPSPPATTPEQIFHGTLAKERRIVARYYEGYELGIGDIRFNIERICRILFPAPYSATTGYQIPADFHRTQLGEMIHAALA